MYLPCGITFTEVYEGFHAHIPYILCSTVIPITYIIHIFYPYIVTHMLKMIIVKFITELPYFYFILVIIFNIIIYYQSISVFRSSRDSIMLAEIFISTSFKVLYIMNYSFFNVLQRLNILMQFVQLFFIQLQSTFYSTILKLFFGSSSDISK